MQAPETPPAPAPARTWSSWASSLNPFASKPAVAGRRKTVRRRRNGRKSTRYGGKRRK